MEQASLDAPEEYSRETYDEYVERRKCLIDGLNRIPGVYSPKIVEGTVIDVTKDEVVVNFGYQSEGSVPFDQWVQGATKETVAPTVNKGDKVTLKVIASENQDGLVVLSKTRAEADQAWLKLP